MSLTKNDSLLPIFDELKELLVKYQPPLTAVVEERGRYELQFDKDYQTKSERTGKVATRHGLYFAGLIVQRHYVGFYFMPVYSHAADFEDISPRLRRALKGRSCFYITELDNDLKREITAVLEKGYRVYDKFDGTVG